jgi:hypothetical protein
MNLNERIELAGRLGNYLLSDEPAWIQAKEMAFRSNPWFIPPFIDRATQQLSTAFLNPQKLSDWATGAGIPENLAAPKKVGLVLASNLPLVGFHDWLAVFISGNHALIKLSAQDSILFEHLAAKLIEWDPRMANQLQIAERLNQAEAFIATGSDNTARYFEYYFGRSPHIIRKNRTSVAILTGRESEAELIALSDDLYSYFGRGCRNVTQLCVPRGYDFKPLLGAGDAYQFLAEHHKLKNNYDYQLALRILNKEYYMTNGIALFVEQPSLYAPIGVVHIHYYDQPEEAAEWSERHLEQIQCRVGWHGIPFGTTQTPTLDQYADGIDTLSFLRELNS